MKNKMILLISALLVSATVLANESVSQDKNNVNPSGATPGVMGFDCDGVCQRNLSSHELFETQKRSYGSLLPEDVLKPSEAAPAADSESAE
jgi:hypothetical protein